MHTHCFVIESSDLAALLAALKSKLSESTRGLIVLATSDNSWSMAGFEEWINQVDIPIAGGFFPGVIFGDQSFLKDALVVMSYDDPIETRIISNLSAGERAHAPLLSTLSITDSPYAHRRASNRDLDSRPAHFHVPCPEFRIPDTHH